ncbi:MAG: outer membrane lipoprotein-sorting protein [Desulfosoma sp.]
MTIPFRQRQNAEEPYCCAAFILWFLVIYVLLAPCPCGAQMPDGKDIAQRIFDRDVGRDSVTEAEMVLLSAGGSERVRRLRVSVKTDGSARKSLIRFLSPADIEGTGFLVLEAKPGDTEQFLYLPALKRSRRIATAQKSQSFVNSDFSYEDLERRAVEASQHRVIGEETVGDVPCWILESTPLETPPSQYGMVRVWAAKEIWVPMRIQYVDKKGEHIKTYTVRNLKQVQGIWTEMEVVMENLKDGHRTILKTLSINYNTGLDDNSFTVRALEAW